MNVNGAALRAATAAVIGAQHKLSEDEARAAAVAAVAAASPHIAAGERDRILALAAEWLPLCLEWPDRYSGGEWLDSFAQLIGTPVLQAGPRNYDEGNDCDGTGT